MTNPHLAAPPVTVGPPIGEARRVALVVHGRDQDPVYMVEHLVGPLGLPDVAYVLPAADGGTWYPGRFSAPRAVNEPRLGHALDALEAAIAGVAPERLVLAGFSQGGCLVADLIARRPRPCAGAAVLTGALIGSGEPAVEPLDGLPVFMETGRYDDWVALESVEATARALEAAGRASSSRSQTTASTASAPARWPASAGCSPEISESQDSPVRAGRPRTR